MGTILKPWTRAAFELIVHAEMHLRDGGDFDRRMAHIGFDNAIEVAISTYLGLNPIQRQRKQYQRTEVDRWMSNYHTKLDFLEIEASSRGWKLKVPNDEVVFYHDIRNSQYHTGGPGVPESDHLHGLRKAALDVFAMLFAVDDVEQVLEEWIYRRLAPKESRIPRNATVDKILDIENEPIMIAGQIYAVSEALYATDPEAYSAVAAAVRESRNCADELLAKYPTFLKSTLIHVGFVHFEETVLLKTVDRSGEISLTNTDFIVDGTELETPIFSWSRSPDENIDRLVGEFDPYSIINCFDLFTDAAAENIAASYSKQDVGNPFDD